MSKSISKGSAIRLLMVTLAGIISGTVCLNGSALDSVMPYGVGIQRIVEEGEASGWTKVALFARYRALSAYENHEEYAESWYYLYRWARRFATDGPEFIERWVEAVQKGGVGHGNMATSYEVGRTPLGDLMPGGLKAFLLSDIDLSREFFSLYSSYDNLIEAFGILAALYEKFPGHFQKYARLAIALTLVYDVPPPPGWPHFQVSSATLARGLPEPAEAFDYWVRLNESRQTPYDLSLLSAGRLIFLVDTPAGFDEMHWARTAVVRSMEKFAEVYDMVHYRQDRVGAGQFIWPGQDYALKSIFEEGGICVDQAYFAAQVGKAHGVPTLIFRGAGLDGRHAWFGFMPEMDSWEFDGGRQGETRYVTGYAFDPQTWRNISDHELAFLSEGFHESYYYEKSVFHSNFAAEYLELHAPELAIEAAERALKYESRNGMAWEAVLIATEETSDDPRSYETVLRRAAWAFRRYPDLEAAYRNRVSESLADRGNLSLARRERDIVATKNRADRTDLSITQAVETLRLSMSQDPLSGQLRTFRVIILQMGKNGGMDLFDRIVRPFVAHLLKGGHERDAHRMALFARDQIVTSDGSMLSRELANLVARIAP